MSVNMELERSCFKLTTYLRLCFRVLSHSHLLFSSRDGQVWCDADFLYKQQTKQIWGSQKRHISSVKNDTIAVAVTWIFCKISSFITHLIFHDDLSPTCLELEKIYVNCSHYLLTKGTTLFCLKADNYVETVNFQISVNVTPGNWWKSGCLLSH